MKYKMNWNRFKATKTSGWSEADWITAILTLVQRDLQGDDV